MPAEVNTRSVVVQWRRIAPLWPISVICAVVIGLRLAIGTWTIDDAYITFRYVRNLLDGWGMVYNPGQPVLGTTTPLYTFVLASVTSMTRLDVPRASLLINAVADGLTVALLYQLAQQMRLPRWAAALCALSWAFYPISLRYAVGGMEASFVTDLTVLALALFMKRHDTSAACVAALGVLARPDALSVWFVVMIGLMLEKRRVPVREGLWTLAICLPWILWATAQFGSPLPQSLQAKSLAVPQTQPDINAIQILLQIGSIGFGSPIGLAAKGLTLSYSTLQGSVLLLTAVILGAVWLIGARYAMQLDRRWRIVLAYAPVFLGAYALLGTRGIVMAEWYIVPAMPFVFLGLYAGWAGAISTRRSRLARPIAFAICCLMAFAQVAGLNFGRDPERGVLVPMAVWIDRETLYREAGEFLRQRVQPGEVVAANEIGALGYVCDCVIFDMIGLVSPEAVTYYPVPTEDFIPGTNYAVPPQMIRDLKPAYILSLDAFTRGALLTANWFQREYQLVWETRTGVFGSRALQLFERIKPAQ